MTLKERIDAAKAQKPVPPKPEWLKRLSAKDFTGSVLAR